MNCRGMRARPGVSPLRLAVPFRVEGRVDILIGLAVLALPIAVGIAIAAMIERGR